MTTPTDLARAMHAVTEPIHAITYFAGPQAAAWQELGLEPRSQGYFAGRAAPLGRVDAGTVAATFFNFNPDVVAMLVPAVWDTASPDQVLQARAAGMAATLRELGVPQDGLAEATELAREAAEVPAFGAGRPLAAANRDVTQPDDEVAALWQAVTTLREHRGDGHVALLVASGLTPLEALVLYTSWQSSVSRKFLQKTRAWDDDAWAAGQAQLREAGLLDDHDELTDDGRGLREQLEARTDELASTPYDHLGETRTRRLWELLQPVAVACAVGFPRTIEVPQTMPA